jgi:predicted lipase
MDSSVLSEVFSLSRVSLISSSSTRKWLIAKGIYPEQVEVGYLTGRFIKNKSESFLRACMQEGIFTAWGKDGKLKTKSKDSLVFPLKDSRGEVVNFWMYDMQKHTSERLNNRVGFYPQYPSNETQVLYLENDILDASKNIAKNRKEKHAIVAIEKGVISTDDLALLSALTELKEVQVSDSISSKEIQKLTDYIQEHELDIQLIANSRETKQEFSIESIALANTSSKEENVVVIPNEMMYRFDTERAECLVLEKDGMTIEVLGGIEAEPLDKLQVTLKVFQTYLPTRSYRDQVNLYRYEQLNQFIGQCASYIGIEASNLESVMDILMHCLEQYRARKAWIPEIIKVGERSLSLAQTESAMELLKNPKLMNITSDLLGNIGIAGEEKNRMITYLVMTSRKLDNPLHLVNYGSTGMGKSHLIEAVSKCIPSDDFFELTSTSAKAFYHLKEYGLKHKMILIQDLFDISDEVLYQIRELQSKKKLTRTVTVKDKTAGFQTILKTIYGPTCIIASSTASEIYPDNSNRSIEITMDESTKQDALILERQRKLSAGVIDVQTEQRNRELLEHAQRLLKNYAILNPYAESLELPELTFKKRRTQAIYLGLIEAITLLHQYQRKTKEIGNTTYLISTPEDIAEANTLMEEILLHKSDMLNQGSRTFFEELKAWSEQSQILEFTRKDMAVGMRKHPSAIKRHMVQLLQLQYLKILKGDRYLGHTYTIAEENEYTHLVRQVQETLAENLQKIKRKQEARQKQSN